MGRPAQDNGSALRFGRQALSGGLNEGPGPSLGVWGVLQSAWLPLDRWAAAAGIPAVTAITQHLLKPDGTGRAACLGLNVRLARLGAEKDRLLPRLTPWITFNDAADKVLGLLQLERRDLCNVAASLCQTGRLRIIWELKWGRAVGGEGVRSFHSLDISLFLCCWMCWWVLSFLSEASVDWTDFRNTSWWRCRPFSRKSPQLHWHEWSYVTSQAEWTLLEVPVHRGVPEGVVVLL